MIETRMKGLEDRFPGEASADEDDAWNPNADDEAQPMEEASQAL